MNIRLEPKQQEAFTTRATEVLYGGAAGGMKSFTLRASAIRWCTEVPGIQVYLFRRTLRDLRDNHLRGPWNLFFMLSELIGSGHVKYRAVENEFAFWNGSALHLCYCDSEADVENYRGAEIHVLGIDELTHFTEYQYRFLRHRVRVAGLAIPEQYAGRLPRIECASNPGSIGHAWVKRTFIAPRPANEVWRCPPEEGGMLRLFLPAKLTDNPYLTRDDPTYADRLRGLGSDSLVRAMLEGDWDLVAGQAFDRLRRDIHGIAPFEPPDTWALFGSLDWGSSRPFSFGLWCVANGDALPDGRTYRRGAIIRWNEIYGWNGKPNEGLRLEAAEVAQRIAGRVAGRRLGYIAADPSMWKVDGGPSIAETMLRHGVVLRKADNSRIVGYIQVRQRIAGDEDGPMLYATTNCHDGFWRTMPDIVMDERHPEDIDTDQEDHCFGLGTKTFFGVVGEDGPVVNHLGIVSALGTKKREADTIKLRFDDGIELVCTPDHLFCTMRGWCEAKDLMDEVCYNVLSERRAQWSVSLAIRCRNFLVCGITFAETIFKSKEFASIESCGNMLTAISPIDGTSTTLTKTGLIINSKILSWFDRQIIFPIIRNRTSGPTQSLLLKKLLGHGTDQRMESLGILIAPRRIGARCAKTQWRKFALSVVLATRRLGLSRTSLFIAAITAVRSRCVGVEHNGKAEVTCLSVTRGRAFALENGTLVHNCADDVRYACMSRPWLAAVKAKKPPRDRWLRAFERDDDEVNWKSA